MPQSKSPQTLILVESPAKAKSIQSYLGDAFLVQATGGHIMDIPSTGLSVNVSKGFAIKKEVLPRKYKQVQLLKKSIHKFNKIIVATDPDREGEAIAFDILELGGESRKQWIRCGFQEITPNAVKEKIAKPDSFQELTLQAQETRRILDRLFGYLISPELWKRIQGGTSAGRVQSVILRWICEREQEIRNFKPDKYLDLHAFEERLQSGDGSPIFQDGGFKWIRKKDIFTPGEVFWKELEKQSIKPIKTIKGKNNNKEFYDWKNQFIVLSSKETASKQYPPPPFKTSSLQEFASIALGWNPKKTMRVAQTLYEGVNLEGGKPMGLITYPRTDSTRLSPSAVTKAFAIIEEKFGKKYIGKNPGSAKIKSGKQKIQDAHEAIRPTIIDTHPEKITNYLNADESKLYSLIHQRFFASLTSAREGTKSEVILDGLGEQWKKEAFQETFPGFTVWYSKKEKSSAKLEYKEGEIISIETISMEWKETEPPSRYTQGSLVKKMESKGVGRPSTYAPSIEVLSERKYIIWDKKFCIPTTLGEDVNSFLVGGFGDLIEDDFTKKMEEDLDRIEEGDLTKLGVLSPFYETLQAKIKQAHFVKKDTAICPTCAKGVVRKKTDKKGKIILYCSRFPECEYGEYA
ncbi:MAG: type I DNA topoisomerase [Leptospira sp.]|nr:type I DNA topoisomerase [Leptospira sp.]